MSAILFSPLYSFLSLVSISTTAVHSFGIRATVSTTQLSSLLNIFPHSIVRLCVISSIKHRTDSFTFACLVHVLSINVDTLSRSSLFYEMQKFITLFTKSSHETVSWTNGIPPANLFPHCLPISCMPSNFIHVDLTSLIKPARLKRNFLSKKRGLNLLGAQS